MFRVSMLCAVLLSACAAPSHYGRFNQAAVRPAPVFVGPPPAMTPGYSPQTYQPAPYTPAGAGLPGERVPGAEKTVPRSPNTRVLPPSDEPGLWAADGAPRAEWHPNYHILDVDIFVTEEESRRFNEPMPDLCTPLVRGYIQEHHIESMLMKLTLNERKCFAYEMFRQCAEGMVAAYSDEIHSPSDPLLSLLNFARQLDRGQCKELPDGSSILKLLAKHKAGMMKRLFNRFIKRQNGGEQQ